MTLDDLELDAIRARVRHLAGSLGLRVEETGREDGFQAVLASPREAEETYFAIAPRGGGYVSLSLLLVVDEAFFRANVMEILETTSRYEVSVSLERDETLEAGEVFLGLGLRLFLEGLSERVFTLGLENLREAREALGESFT